jgi:hypothetical protein
MVGLVRGDLLDLEHFAVTEFIIENANAAVRHAAANAGAFKLTVLRPAGQRERGFLKTRAVLPHAASTMPRPPSCTVRPTKRGPKTKVQTLANSVAC